MGIAQTILNQIKAGTDGYNRGTILMMCWGFHKPYALEKGLGFKVKGLKLQGTVEVVLDEGVDLYDITFKNRLGNVKQVFRGCYAEDLTSNIDLIVGK